MSDTQTQSAPSPLGGVIVAAALPYREDAAAPPGSPSTTTGTPSTAAGWSPTAAAASAPTARSASTRR